MASYKGRPSSVPTVKPFEAFFWITPEKKDEESSDFTSAVIDWHYPEDVSAITKEFRDIPQFCFPDLETIKIERADKAKSEHFTFTLTDGDGARVYGICLRVFDAGVGRRYDVLRRPRQCLCFITKYPFFSMLRVALLCLHSMRLLMQDCELEFLSAVYNKRVSLSGDVIPISPDPSKGRYREFQLFATARGGSSHSDVPIAPLVEVLGIERFLLILSAALCERRIIFIATDVEKLSTSVHAAAAMLYPFQWQHIFIPLLPSKLLSYAAAPVPYMIGVRRYLLPMLAKEAMEDVIIVDCDSGDCTMHGNISVRNIIGDAGNARKQASESFDRVKAEFNKYLLSMNRNDTDTAAAVAANATSRDVVACILADLKSSLGKRPSGAVSSVQLSLIRLGRSAADTSRDRWAAEFEVTIRESLMLFFVFLFGDMHDMMRVQTASTSQSRGTTKSGEAFGQGDWRAALDVHAFLQRRIQLGTSKDLLDLISDMMHSQMFEKFCEERLRRKNLNKPANEDAELEIFDRVCLELSNRQLQPTVNNIKSVLDSIQKSDSAKVDDVVIEGNHEGSSPKDVAARDSYQAKRSGDNLEQFHQLTLKLTSNSTKDSTGDMEEWTNKICSDAWRSDHFERICRSVWLRLEDCKQFNWRHGYKGLLLLRSLLLLGPECMLSNSLDHIPLLQSLTTYKSNSSSEVRGLVRSKAKEVLSLVLDQKLLTIQRKFWAAHRLGAHQFYNLQQRMQEQLRRDLQTSGNASFHPQSPNQLPHFRDIHMGFKPPDDVLNCAPVMSRPHKPAGVSSLPQVTSALPRRQQQAVIADLLDFDFEVGQAIADAPVAEGRQISSDPWSSGFRKEVSESRTAGSTSVNPFDAPAATSLPSTGFESFGDETSQTTGDGFDNDFGEDPFASPMPSSVPPPTKPPKPAPSSANSTTASAQLSAPPLVQAAERVNNDNGFEEALASKGVSDDGFGSSFANSSDPFSTPAAAAAAGKSFSGDGFSDSFGTTDPFASSSYVATAKPPIVSSKESFDTFGSDPFAAPTPSVAKNDSHIVSASTTPFDDGFSSTQPEDAFSKDPFATVSPVRSPHKTSVSSDGFGESFGSSDPFASRTDDNNKNSGSSGTTTKAHSAKTVTPVKSSSGGFGEAFSSDPFSAAPTTAKSTPVRAMPPVVTAKPTEDPFVGAPSKGFDDAFTASTAQRTTFNNSKAFSSNDGFGDAFANSDPFAKSSSADPFSKAKSSSDPFASPFGSSTDPFAAQSTTKGFDPFASASSDPFASSSDPFASSGKSSVAPDPFASGSIFATKTSDPFGDTFGASAPQPAQHTIDPYAFAHAPAAAPFPVIRTQLPPGAPPQSYGAKKTADPFADISQSWMKKK